MQKGLKTTQWMYGKAVSVCHPSASMHLVASLRENFPCLLLVPSL